MTEESKRRLVEAGIDVDDALARLMQNEGLLMRLLRAFLQDIFCPAAGKPLPKGMFPALLRRRTRSRAWRAIFR